MNFEIITWYCFLVSRSLGDIVQLWGTAEAKWQSLNNLIYLYLKYGVVEKNQGSTRFLRKCQGRFAVRNKGKRKSNRREWGVWNVETIRNIDGSNIQTVSMRLAVRAGGRKGMWRAISMPLKLMQWYMTFYRTSLNSHELRREDRCYWSGSQWIA